MNQWFLKGAARRGGAFLTEKLLRNAGATHFLRASLRETML